MHLVRKTNGVELVMIWLFILVTFLFGVFTVWFRNSLKVKSNHENVCPTNRYELERFDYKPQRSFGSLLHLWTQSTRGWGGFAKGTLRLCVFTVICLLLAKSVTHIEAHCVLIQMSDRNGGSFKFRHLEFQPTKMHLVTAFARGAILISTHWKSHIVCT